MDNETKLPMDWKPLREAAETVACEVSDAAVLAIKARARSSFYEAEVVATMSLIWRDVVSAHALLLADLGRPASRLTWVFWLQQQQVEPPPGWTWWEIVSDADSAPALRAALLVQPGEGGVYEPTSRSPWPGSGAPFHCGEAMDNKIEFPEINSAEWRELVTEYDPFDGDFGDGTERTLRDDVSVAKRRGVCRECGQPILKGEIVRTIKKADSEGFYGGRCCVLCCEAMAKVSFAYRGGFGGDDEAYTAAIDAMGERAALLAVVPA